MMDKPFPCTECGLCCRHIGGVEELAPLDRGDGVCVHLINDRCAIYEDRPDICRVDVMYKKGYDRSYTLEEFYTLNLDVCKKLQQKYNWEG